MEYLIDVMKAEDWTQVRSIYLEGIATGNSTFEADVPDWEKWELGEVGFCSPTGTPVSGQRRRSYSGMGRTEPRFQPLRLLGCSGTQSVRGGQA